MNLRTGLKLGLASAAFALAAGIAAAQAQSSVVAIQNVRIFDGDKIIPNGSVVVRDGKIDAIGARVRAPAGAQVIDGAGKTLIPGLIDAHVHVADSYKANGGTAFEEAAAYGVTTVFDLASGNAEDFVAARKALRDGAVPNGADLFAAGPGATTQQLKEPAEAQAWVDTRKSGGSDYIKMFAFAPTDRGGPDAALKPETMKAVISAAHKNGLLTIAHSVNEPISRQLVKDGLDGLVHLNGAGVNAPDFGKLLASNGTFQSTNMIGAAPVSYRVALAEDSSLAPFMPAFMIDGLKNARPPAAGAYENQIANFKAIKNGGALMLAGTDSFYPYNPMLHAELAIVVNDGGATPVEALKMATSNVAKAYKLKDRGRIAKGLRADLVLVNGDPTANILDTRKIDSVWVAGRKIDRDALKAKLTAISAPPPRGGGPGPAPAAPAPSAPAPAPR